MEKSRLTLGAYLSFVAMIISSNAYPSRSQQQSITGSDITTGLMPPIKKDVFMSRGWGASGMPYTMFYLNHFAKAQKSQNSQMQQQQLQKLRQQEVAAAQLQASEDEFERPRTLPYGSRFADSMANTQPSEIGNGGGFKEMEEYPDGAVYLPSKSSSPRRQYNVPQLFVSYGWGPMG